MIFIAASQVVLTILFTQARKSCWNLRQGLGMSRITVMTFVQKKVKKSVRMVVDVCSTLPIQDVIVLERDIKENIVILKVTKILLKLIS